MSGRRARLARLEARRAREDAGDVVGIFEADLSAGVWRETGEGGRVFPMTPEDIGNVGEAARTGGAVLMLAPAGGVKLLAGVTWDAL